MLAEFAMIGVSWRKKIEKIGEFRVWRKVPKESTLIFGYIRIPFQHDVDQQLSSEIGDLVEFIGHCGHNKLGYFWASLRRQLGFATTCAESEPYP